MDGGAGSSDLGVCKMRFEWFLQSMVSGEVFPFLDFFLFLKCLFSFFIRFNYMVQDEIGAILLCLCRLFIWLEFLTHFFVVISGIVDVFASSCSKTPSMDEENEKLVTDLLKFLVGSSCIKMKGSEFLTPPLKRKGIGIDKSPGAPLKRLSKKSNPTQHSCNVDAKVLFPEVEVIETSKEPIKEVTLNDKLNKMCNDSDALHNKQTVVGSKVEGATTARTLQSPAVSIVSEDRDHGNVGFVSIPESSRFPLSPQEKLVYNAVCSLSNSKHARFTVVDIGGCILRYFSLGESMAPGKEVCTYVVNALCRKYFLDGRPTVSRKHYFFSGVAEVFLSKSADYSSLQKSFCGAASVLPLPLCDSLFFPAMFRKHWFLFVVDLKNKFFMFLDSYYSRQDEFSTYTRKKLKDGFCCAWGMFVGPDTRFNEFRTGYAHVPKQVNKVDCGVFLIKFMELWWYGCKMVELFSQEDIPSIRVQILYDLVYCKHNTADIKAVNDFIAIGGARA